MRSGMAAAAIPSSASSGVFQYSLHHQQLQHQQSRTTAGGPSCASPVSQVSVAELAKIFGPRQRSASLQRQPQQPQLYQTQQPQLPHQYPTMDKRLNPPPYQASQHYQLQQQQHSQQHNQHHSAAVRGPSPMRRCSQQQQQQVIQLQQQQQMLYGDPRLRQDSGGSSSGGFGGGSGRWRSQESLGEVPISTGAAGSSGLMFRSVQVADPPRLLPSGVPPVTQPLSQSHSANFATTTSSGNQPLILKPSAFRPVRIGGTAVSAPSTTTAAGIATPSVVTPPSGDSGFVDGGSRCYASSQEGPPLPPHPALLGMAAVASPSEAVSSPTAASPSDSGLLVDYESLLREKDNELAVLRRTMEQNESALMRVFEERQAELESRLRNEVALNARLTPAVSLGNRRLRQSEQAISDLKQQSQQQVAEIQSLKGRLRSAEADLRDRSGRVHQLEGSLAASRESLDAATHELRRMRIQQQQAEVEGSSSSRLGTASAVSTVGRKAAATAERGCQTVVVAAAAASQSDDVERQQLVLELNQIRMKLIEQKQEFDQERTQWLEEKAQVLGYQKQLQMNYLQLTKRSQRLEAEAQQLSVDLESKEMYIMHLATDGFEESTATLNSHQSGGSQC